MSDSPESQGRSKHLSTEEEAVMTPSRSDASLLNASDSATPNGLDDAARNLRAEYEAYKLKTKDWQAKVRDRDTKMRLQLQQTTEQLQSKDAELDEIHKLVAELRSELAVAAAKQAQLKSLEVAKVSAESDVACIKEQLDEQSREKNALLNRLSASEAELEQRFTELRHMRSRVEHLEKTNAISNYKQTGLHVVLPIEGSQDVAAGAEAVCRVAVHDEEYCFCRNSAGEAAWVHRELLPSCVHVPRSLADVIAEDLRQKASGEATALAAAFDAERQALRASLLEAQQNSDIALLEAQKAAQGKLLAEQEAHREEIAALRSIAHATEERLNDLRDRELPAAVASAVAEATGKLQATLDSLNEQVRTLEAYKLKAQLAMRSASASVNVDALRRDIEAECERSFKLRLSDADARLEAFQAASADDRKELSRQLELLERAAAQHAAERDEALCARLELEQELRHAREQCAESEERRKRDVEGAVMLQQQKQLTCTSSSAQTDPTPTTSDDIKNTSRDALETSESVRDAARPPLRRVAHPLVQSKGPSLGCLPGTEFSMDAMLHSLTTVAGLHSDPRADDALEVERYKQELRQQASTAHKLREELREMALREKRLLEQDAVLKEQLRETERAASRAREFGEREDYLKNVVLRALTCRDAHIKKLLMPVVAEVFHLGPSERAQLVASCDT